MNILIRTLQIALIIMLSPAIFALAIIRTIWKFIMGGLNAIQEND